MNLMDRIRLGRSALPGQQKRVVDYLIAHYPRSASMTAEELSLHTGVSKATITRTAYKLGCDGLPGLQRELHDSLPSRLTTVERLNMLDGLGSADVVAASFQTDIHNLRTTAAQNSPVLIDAVVDIMDTARRLYLAGSRSSRPLVEFLEYYLRYILESVRMIRFDGSDVYTQMLGMSHADCVLAVSFPRYSSYTLEWLEYARTTGARLIVLTDHYMAPPALLSDYTLTARSHMSSFVDSFVAPLALINVLIMKLGLRRRGQLNANFEHLEALWHQHGVYAQPDEPQ